MQCTRHVQNYEYTYHQIACTHRTWSIGLQRLQNEFPLLGVPTRPTRPRLLAILDEVGPMLAIPLQEPSAYGHIDLYVSMAIHQALE